jgi:antitoxin MazE
MTKNLVSIGNSLGIIIEKPILDLLGISRETLLEVKTDGRKLVLEPVEDARRSHIRSLTRKVMKSHEKTFRKLAE